MFDSEKIISIFISVFVIFISIVLHEISHAAVAYCLGDDTAKRSGRLNFHTHFDFFGSFLIPLCLFFLKSPFLIGYAKPIPIDPRKFKDPLKDMAIVAIAGPLCNFILAVIAALILKNLSDPSEIIVKILMSFLFCNLALMLFNLIPIPPLDGSRLVAAILPKKMLLKYYSLEPYGFFLVIGLEFFLRFISDVIGKNVSLFHNLIEIPIRGILIFLFS